MYYCGKDKKRIYFLFDTEAADLMIYKKHWLIYRDLVWERLKKTEQRMILN